MIRQLIGLPLPNHVAPIQVPYITHMNKLLLMKYFVIVKIDLG